MRIFEIRKATNEPGDELKEQLEKWPKAANHDRIEDVEPGNYIFSKVYDPSDQAIKVYNMNFENPHNLLVFVAREMLNEDRSRPIHLSKSQLRTLHNSDIWRLWCGKQETKEELEEAYTKVFGQGLDLRKSHATLIEEVKDDIKGYFQ